MADQLEPRWAFTKSGRTRFFADGVLPPNWHATPDVITDPAKRDSWALTQAAEREKRENLPVDEPDDEGVMPPKAEAERVAIPVMVHEFERPLVKNIPSESRNVIDAEPVKKRRGRPPGSKNKAA